MTYFMVTFTLTLKRTSQPTQNRVVEMTLTHGVLDIKGFKHVVREEGLLIENLGADITGDDKPIVLLPFVCDLLGDLRSGGVLGFLAIYILNGLLQYIVRPVDDHPGLPIGGFKNLTIPIGSFAFGDEDIGWIVDRVIEPGVRVGPKRFFGGNGLSQEEKDQRQKTNHMYLPRKKRESQKFFAIGRFS